MSKFKKNMAITLCFVLSFLFVSCGGNGGSGGGIVNFDSEVISEEEQSGVKLITVYNGSEQDLLAPALREYLDEDDYDKQCKFLKDHKNENYDVTRIYLEWDGVSGREYSLYIADNENFSRPNIIKTTESEYFPSFLIPGKTYYWKVEDLTDGTTSAIDSFKVKDLPVRIIKANGTNNVRDMGGWKTEGGKTVRYGMIYRGARINSTGNVTTLAESGLEVFKNVLKIKSEIDLRTPNADDAGQTENCIDPSSTYLKAPFTQYTYIFPQFSQNEPVKRSYDERTKSSLQSIFELLADESNYPVYVHCNAGADRTGTIAFLVNGLLGVGYENLTRDFEITSFTSQKTLRWRGSEGNFKDGVMQDDSNNYVAWGKMYDYMMRYYGEGKTLSEAIENYLTSHCEIKKVALEKVKALLLA